MVAHFCSISRGIFCQPVLLLLLLVVAASAVEHLPAGLLPLSGLWVLLPLVADRGELVPKGLSNDREPVAQIVLLEEGDAGRDQAEGIGRSLLAAVLPEPGGLARPGDNCRSVAR